MKTVSTYFITDDNLKHFISQHKIVDSSKLLIQIFTSNNTYDFIERLTGFFSEYFPLSSLIGSTTDGEIKDGLVSTDITIICFSIFENVELKTYILNEFENYYQAGVDLASNLIKKDTKLIISFIDGLLGNGEEYVNGVNSVNEKIVIAGGLAGDYAKFEKTYIFTKDKIYSKGVVGVSLSSKQLNIFTDYSFSWHPLGQKLKITKAEKNRVYMINDKTALETYSYYLGKDISDQLPFMGIEFPLILERNGVNIARAVIGKNDDGSLTFAGNLHNMDEVRFGYGNSDDILNNTQKHIDKLYDQPVESIFIYSCMARRRFMPDKIERETLFYNQIAPTNGLYLYGEFFSAANSKELLNQSMTILALSESNESSKKKITVNKEKNISTTIQALSNLIHVTTKELEEKDTIMISQSRNAAMGEMLNMIAHQWRQPLNVISMTASNLQVDMQLETLDEKAIEEYTNTILEEASTLSSIIDNFRNYFSPSENKEEFSITSLIENAKDIIDLALKEKNINLVIQSKTTTTLNTYKKELIQVLLNLINNSRDAFEANNINTKTIIISTKESSETIVIDVSDNAGGIKKKFLKQIFEPYFTTKEELNGTGLGLYMSKIIVEKYLNGKITVQNTSYGACFSIYLHK